MDERHVILNDLQWGSEKVDESLSTEDCGLDRDSLFAFLDGFFPSDRTALEYVALGISIGINAERARSKRLSSVSPLTH